jgi:hypothetical protein
VTSGIRPPDSRRPTSDDFRSQDPSAHRLAEMNLVLQQAMRAIGVPTNVIQNGLNELSRRIEDWLQDRGAHLFSGRWTPIQAPPEELVSELTAICHRLSRDLSSASSEMPSCSSEKMSPPLEEVITTIGRRAREHAVSAEQMIRMPADIYLMSLAKCAWTYLRLPGFSSAVRGLAKQLEEGLLTLPPERPASVLDLHSVVRSARKKMFISEDSMLVDPSLVDMQPVNANALVVLLLDALIHKSIYPDQAATNPSAAEACLSTVHEVLREFGRHGSVSWSTNSTRSGMDFMPIPYRKALKEAARNPGAFIESVLERPTDTTPPDHTAWKAFTSWFGEKIKASPWSDLQLARILWDELSQTLGDAGPPEFASLNIRIQSLEAEAQSTRRATREASIMGASELGYLAPGGAPQNDVVNVFVRQAIGDGRSNGNSPPLRNLLGGIYENVISDWWIKDLTTYLGALNAYVPPPNNRKIGAAGEAAHANLVKELLRFAWREGPTLDQRSTRTT